MMQGNGSWHALVVEWRSIQISVPYDSHQDCDAFVATMARLLCPDEIIVFASLHRAETPDGFIGRYWGESGNESAVCGDTLDEKHSMGSLRLPAITHAVIDIKCKEKESTEIACGKSRTPAFETCLSSSIAIRDEVIPHPASRRDFASSEKHMGIHVWWSARGKTTKHRCIFLDRNGTMGSLRSGIEEVFGVAGRDQHLLIPTITLTAAQVADRLDGGPHSVVRGEKNTIIWGHFGEGGIGVGAKDGDVKMDNGGIEMERMPNLEDDVFVRTGARLCSGDHLLILEEQTHTHTILVEASVEWEHALLNGPASFVVWVNCPGTVDFSIGIVAHPWTSTGANSIVNHVPDLYLLMQDDCAIPVFLLPLKTTLPQPPR